MPPSVARYPLSELRVFSASIALLSVICAIGAGPQSETAPAWKFKAGDTLRCKIRYNLDAKVESNGVIQPSAEIASHLDLTLSWSVMRVGEDGTADIVQKVEHVREEGKERSPARQRLVYDSADARTIDNPWSGMKSAFYGPIIGASYEVKMDRRGGVLDVRLPKDALKGWESSSLQPQEGRDLLFTKDGFKALLSEMPKLPSDPLPRGESWQNRQEETVDDLQSTFIETYSLSGQQGRTAIYEAKPEVVLKVLPRSVAELGKPNLSTKLDPLDSATVETQSGECKLSFDKAAGRMMGFSRRHHYEVNYMYKNKVGSKTPRTDKVTTNIVSEIDFTP